MKPEVYGTLVCAVCVSFNGESKPTIVRYNCGFPSREIPSSYCLYKFCRDGINGCFLRRWDKVEYVIMPNGDSVPITNVITEPADDIIMCGKL